MEDTRITKHDIYLFKEGNHFNLYNKLGAHIEKNGGKHGVHFSVWAPNAGKVSVIGDFNGWNPDSDPLSVRWDESGIWEGFVENIDDGTLYKYHIVSRINDFKVNIPFHKYFSPSFPGISSIAQSGTVR